MTWSVLLSALFAGMMMLSVDSEGDAQMFMGKIRRYATITELDNTVLNRLINRIYLQLPVR